MPSVRRYVSQIPPGVREEIRRNLDSGQSWRDLAVKLLSNQVDIDLLDNERFRGSPANELLKRLSNMQITTDELFSKLQQMRQIELCKLLKPFVSASLGGSVADATPELQPSYVEIEDEEIPDTLLPPRALPARSDNPSAGVLQGSHTNRPSHDPEDSNSTRQRSAAEETNVNSYEFNYKELALAADGFSNSFLLGEGRIHKTYRANLNGTVYSVKVQRNLEDPQQNQQRKKQLLAEMLNLCLYQHENILRLLGYSNGPALCLVYQYMANGSLEDRLACKSGTEPLPQLTRLRVCVGVARGLRFLHSVQPQPVIHGNLTCGNVLLDSEMRPHLADLSLARNASSESQETAYRGRFTHHTVMSRQHALGQEHAYLAPELLNAQRKLSLKSDVYALGVILWCIITGQRAYDEQRKNPSLTSLIDDLYDEYEGSDDALHRKLWEISDPRCTDWGRPIFLRLCELARRCSHEKKLKRPDLTDIQLCLEEQLRDAQIEEESPQTSEDTTLLVRRFDVTDKSVSQLLHQLPEDERRKIKPKELQMLHDQRLQRRQSSETLESVEPPSLPEPSFSEEMWPNKDVAEINAEQNSLANQQKKPVQDKVLTVLQEPIASQELNQSETSVVSCSESEINAQREKLAALRLELGSDVSPSLHSASTRSQLTVGSDLEPQFPAPVDPPAAPNPDFRIPTINGDFADLLSDWEQQFMQKLQGPVLSEVHDSLQGVDIYGDEDSPQPPQQPFPLEILQPSNTSQFEDIPQPTDMPARLQRAQSREDNADVAEDEPVYPVTGEVHYRHGDPGYPVNGNAVYPHGQPFPPFYDNFGYGNRFDERFQAPYAGALYQQQQHMFQEAAYPGRYTGIAGCLPTPVSNYVHQPYPNIAACQTPAERIPPSAASYTTQGELSSPKQDIKTVSDTVDLAELQVPVEDQPATKGSNPSEDEYLSEKPDAPSIPNELALYFAEQEWKRLMESPVDQAKLLAIERENQYRNIDELLEVLRQNGFRV